MFLFDVSCEKLFSNEKMKHKVGSSYLSIYLYLSSKIFAYDSELVSAIWL